MASRIALFLMCLSLCVTAAHGEMDAEKDPLALIKEKFDKLGKEACATALVCLWLELAQLPRRRMIERIDTVFMQSKGLVNISAERAMLENDDTFNNMDDAREALRGIKRRLDAMYELESKMGDQRLAIVSALQNGSAVVGGMNLAIGAIYFAAGPIIHKVNVQVSLSNMKEDLSKVQYFREAMAIANQTVNCVMGTWWKDNTELLVDNLRGLITNSSLICGKHVPRGWRKSYRNYPDYDEAIKFAASDNKKDLIKYMETIGSIDNFDERQRNASGKTTSQLLSNGFAKQLEDILSDMNTLKVLVREIRKERAQLLAAKQKSEEERRHSCTDLWSQLLALVRLK
ncbi:hypothetical protein ERJ75_000080800 [Trypanosoma vivax]|nr:hypothetical protein ERJ75_000080800 [Trypanosoma vivax]